MRKHLGGRNVCKSRGWCADHDHDKPCPYCRISELEAERNRLLAAHREAVDSLKRACDARDDWKRQAEAAQRRLREVTRARLKEPTR